MASIYLQGKYGTDPNLKKAYELTKELSMKQIPYALFNLGSLHLYGSKSKVPREGFEGLTAHQLHTMPDAAEDYVIEPDTEFAIKCFEEAAKQEFAPACYLLGNVYHYGNYGVKRDIHKAVSYLLSAVNQNHADACYYLYLLITEDGEVVFTRLFDKPKQYLKNFPALYNLLESADDFDISKASITELRYFYCELFFSMAVRLNSGDALYEMGDRLFHGKKGQKVDYKAAFKSYEQAANAKNKDAFYCLGVMYYQGIYVKKNYTKAFERYSAASSLGSKEALLSMADMAREGKGIPKDKKYADHLENAYIKMVEEQNN
jgi:TPR repeat protein